MVELLPARFEGPPFFGCNLFFLAFLFFFFFFSVSSASSRRVCKKPYFYRDFFAHPAKASSDIIQQQ